MSDDLIQGMRKQLKLSSELDSGADPVTSWKHAYYGVEFILHHPAHEWPRHYGHVFIWSPRKLRFIHFTSWGECPDAREGSCPWGRNPRDAAAEMSGDVTD